MALRSLRDKKPTWFQNKFANEIINYSLGIYYGFLGVYFIIRGFPGTDSGIYTDMLLNILIVLNLFSSAGPATVALLLIISGKIILGDALFSNLFYVFLIIGFHFVCVEAAKLRLSTVRKVVLIKLGAIPLMLLYLHQKIYIAYSKEPHYLAESIGLYMEYLVEVNDSAEFQKQVALLQKNFITEDNFIK